MGEPASLQGVEKELVHTWSTDLSCWVSPHANTPQCSTLWTNISLSGPFSFPPGSSLLISDKAAEELPIG